MGINWLNMAQLGRTVTGLDWGRFSRAHGPPALLALVIGVAALLAAEAGRAAHLSKLPILLGAGVAAALAGFTASRLRPALFLGPHGTWTYQQAEAVFRRRSRGVASSSTGEPERVVPMEEASSTG
jgi:hypothetical protein